MNDYKKNKPYNFFINKKKYVTKKKYEEIEETTKKLLEQNKLHIKKIKQLQSECGELRKKNYYYSFNNIECLTISKWDFINTTC